jgi:protein-disulfide isomerase
VTLVEYGDFECPDCLDANAAVEAVRQRLRGDLRFVFRNFPLVRAHPHALHAAEAAESVAAHAGPAAYWAMYDALFAHVRRSPHALDDDHLVRYAAAAGADGARVRAEVAAGTHEARVRADFTSGVWSGVRAAPTFFVNGVRFDGDWRDARAFAWALEHAAGPGRRPSALGNAS